MKTVVLMVVSALISGGVVYTLTQKEESTQPTALHINKKTDSNEAADANTISTKKQKKEFTQLAQPKIIDESKKLRYENTALKAKIAELEKNRGRDNEKLAEIQKNLSEVKKNQEKTHQLHDFTPKIKSIKEISEELDLNEYEIEEIKKIEKEKEEAQTNLIQEILGKRHKNNEKGSKKQIVMGEEGFNMIKKMNELKKNHEKKINELLGEEKGQKFNKMRGSGNMVVQISEDLRTTKSDSNK